MSYDEEIEKERHLFQEEGRKYQRLVELGRRVHQPVIVPLWNLKITTAGGGVRVNRDSYGHSFTRNLYNAHTQYSLFRRVSAHNTPIPDTYAEGGLGLKRITGSVLTSGFRATLFPEPNAAGGGYGIPAADTSYGFVAGTGVTAESFDDFVVQGLIAHGAGAGQLSYAIGTLSKAFDGGDRFKSAQWGRALTNSSGDTISVGNVCMYFKDSAGVYAFVREVLGPPQDVLDTEVLTFTYEFRMYFPEV